MGSALSRGLGGLALCVVPIVALATGPEQSADAGGELTFEEHVRPFLRRYCFRCHGGRRPEGDLNLAAYADAPAVVEGRREWERVLRMLVHREMPPADKRQPPDEERERIARWIHEELEKFDCSGAVDPGRVTLRRLNRAEYDNTVRDLLGIDFQPADDFPADEVGYGFDNIGDVLSLPPLLLEKYLDAADRVVESAVRAELSSQGRASRREAEKLTDATTDARPTAGTLGIYKTGEVPFDEEFPPGGEYFLRARAFAEQAGTEVARMAFKVDGREVAAFDVAAEADMPQVYEARVRVEPGRHRCAIAYLNNYVNQNHPDPKLRGDRNLFVDWFEFEPAVGDGGGAPRIFVARPDDSRRVGAAARRVLESFLRRAWRRPPTDEELDRSVQLVEESAADGDSFEEAVAAALKAALVSPFFLFRVEIHPQPADAEAIVPVSDWELASRLSYFLWSSMPDEELFALAEVGKLGEPGVLDQQVARMLADPKSRAFVDNFAGQWLKTRQLVAAAPDPGAFPEFDESLREAMAAETRLFFETVLRENRSVAELIDADWTFVNGRLARHYGIPDIEGEEFRRVELPPGGRGGVLTHASILTLTSNPTRTSPVKRGVWVLEQILAEPPPPPPPDVPTLADQEAILSGSLRQRMEQHRENPACAQCHERMDAIGFALENFDAIGRWREKDGEFPIDPSGELPGGREFRGPAELKKLLTADIDKFAHALAEKLLTYALGRGLEYYDVCALDSIVGFARENDYRFGSMVAGVVRTAPFRTRRGEGEER